MNLIETNGLTAASDALRAAYQDFFETEQALKESMEEVRRRIADDAARDAARAEELDEEAAVSTGVRAVMLAQRAKDYRAKTHGMTDEERDLLVELKTDAEEKLSALRVVRKSTIDAAAEAKNACEELRTKALKTDVDLYRNWIDTSKFEKRFGSIGC